METKLSEQFDVLSNALRVLPEEAIKLNYFLNKINEPEEGISNIEIACVNVFNQIYVMMCSLKDHGHINSIYSQDAITTALCIRHVLQHQSGRIKNNLRDTFKKQIPDKYSLVDFDDSMNFPFMLNINWLQESIKKSHNSKRLDAINIYWNLNHIKEKIELKSYNWKACYINVLAIITEAVHQIRINYGHNFVPSGDDSEVYYQHFNNIKTINTNKYSINF